MVAVRSDAWYHAWPRGRILRMWWHPNEKEQHVNHYAYRGRSQRFLHRWSAGLVRAAPAYPSARRKVDRRRRRGLRPEVRVEPARRTPPHHRVICSSGSQVLAYVALWILMPAIRRTPRSTSSCRRRSGGRRQLVGDRSTRAVAPRPQAFWPGAPCRTHSVTRRATIVTRKIWPRSASIAVSACGRPTEGDRSPKPSVVSVTKL